ncbi:MAG: 4Fe-4S binding protein [Coriobacteriia bacterium]|nr:4Fe-4S binding protein [Coriobacteriia bacterium]
MKRTIINIDANKCNGCGLCVDACFESAIELIDGKAVLVREDFCDGLGNCLPACPEDAITFEEREAPAYNEAAVVAYQNANAAGQAPHHADGPHAHAHAAGHAAAAAAAQPTGGCPGAAMRDMRASAPASASTPAAAPAPATAAACCGPADTTPTQASVPSALTTWPIQIKLVPTGAPYFAGADLLVAADCAAFAYGNFHQDFMKDRITLIGCPKLDDIDYSEKLAIILANNDIRSLTIIRMEVPCCGGLTYACEQAIAQSGKSIPLRTVIIGIEGDILADE